MAPGRDTFVTASDVVTKVSRRPASATWAMATTTSTDRIEGDIETLAGADYTLSAEAIRRYAYTDVYRNTLAYFTEQFEALGFDVHQDPVGNLVARNRPRGERVFGLGSH